MKTLLLDKARQKLAHMNMTDAERKRYEKYLVNTAKDKDAINTAKEEGEQIGAAKEKTRRDEELVRKCLAKGMLVGEITELTDLPPGAIMEIINRITNDVVR